LELSVIIFESVLKKKFLHTPFSQSDYLGHTHFFVSVSLKVNTVLSGLEIETYGLVIYNWEFENVVTCSFWKSVPKMRIKISWYCSHRLKTAQNPNHCTIYEESCPWNRSTFSCRGVSNTCVIPSQIVMEIWLKSVPTWTQLWGEYKWLFSGHSC
jgi:hypothetical protein